MTCLLCTLPKFTSSGTPIIADLQSDAIGVKYDFTPHQTITFEECIFEDLKFSEHDNAHYTHWLGNEYFTDASTIILAGFSENTVIIRDSVFRRNQLDSAVRAGTLCPEQ